MAEQKKWYETKLGKLAANPLLAGPLVALGTRAARGITKKYEEANKGIGEQISALEKMELAPETQQAYQESQAMKNLGLSGSAQALQQQMLGRGLAGLYGQARDRRSFLAGAGQFGQMIQDYGLRASEMEDERRRQNALMAQQMGMQYGGQKLGLQQYKQEGLFDYWMGKKQALNRTLTGLATGVARIGAAALTGGASEADEALGLMTKAGKSSPTNTSWSSLIGPKSSLGYTPMGLKK
jgi:hypothetical protein